MGEEVRLGEGCLASGTESRAKTGRVRQARTAVSSSYLPPGVGDPEVPAVFGGERLDPTALANEAPGPD